LNIKTAVIADIDLLKEQRAFDGVYAALGGDVSAIMARYASVATKLSDQGASLAVQDFVAELKLAGCGKRPPQAEACATMCL